MLKEEIIIDTCVYNAWQLKYYRGVTYGVSIGWLNF